MDDEKTCKTIIESLQKLKYTVFYKILDAQNFGLTQKTRGFPLVKEYKKLVKCRN